MSDVPNEREQNRAQQLLSSHWSAGRLSTEEYDERMDRAQRATSRTELSSLFNDLPGEKPFADPLDYPTSQASASQSFPVYTPPTAVGETPTANLPAVIQPQSMTRQQYRNQRRADRAAYRAARHTPQGDRAISDSAIGSIMGAIWMVTIGLIVFGHGAGGLIWVAILASIFLPQFLRGLRRTNGSLPPTPRPPSLPSAHRAPDEATPAAPSQPDYSAPPPPRDTPRSYLDLPEDDDPQDPHRVGGGLR